VTGNVGEFRAEVRDWLAAHVPAGPLPSVDTAEGFERHREWERELAAARLSVVSWPAEYGGRDASLLEWLAFEEEYYAAGAPVRVGQNGLFLLAPTLFAHGTPAQRDRVLPPMARADEVWAQAWSEPEAGSDLAAIRARGVRVDGGWLLSGTKTWSSRAAFADRAFGLFRSVPLGGSDPPQTPPENGGLRAPHTPAGGTTRPPIPPGARPPIPPWRDAPGILILLVGQAERGEGPPGNSELRRRFADPGDGLERRPAEVDRGLAAGRRVHPGRLEELLAGRDQLHRAGPDALGVTGQHDAAKRHVVEQQLHPVGEHRGEGLHTLHRNPVSDLAEHLRRARVLFREFLRAGADARGQQEFTARWCPQAVRCPAGAALVGDLEDADLLDGVAEELDPQRVLLRWREDVEQPTADRELAPLGDHLHPRVADVDEPRDHVVRVGLAALPQPDRVQVAEPGGDRLQHAAHRRDDDLEWPSDFRVPTLAVGMGKAAEDRDSLAYRVQPRRQPLVRQRLPAGEARHRIRRQERAKRRGQVIGLPGGRGHREHEPAGAADHAGGQGSDQQRPQRRRRDEITRAAWTLFDSRTGRSGKRVREVGIFGYGGE
jgi:Acyl-CoA dehydrogenase, N-terminal domain/Acyl-CoA dehydrogenase, middle domain